MKHLLLTTIAAVVLVGCGPQPPDILIVRAASKGNIEAVKQHLAAGTDVNARWGVAGLTPLHLAAQFGRKEVAEMLIANGADVNAKTEDGWTPLHDAASEGRKKVAELLIAKGADLNVKGFGKTPLDWAISGKHPATNLKTLRVSNDFGGFLVPWYPCFYPLISPRDLGSKPAFSGRFHGTTMKQAVFVRYRKNRNVYHLVWHEQGRCPFSPCPGVSPPLFSNEL